LLPGGRFAAVFLAPSVGLGFVYCQPLLKSRGQKANESPGTNSRQTTYPKSSAKPGIFP
jgi:hypothetical protein